MEIRDAASANEIRVVQFDVGGVLVELSGLAILLSWLGHRVSAEQVRMLWLTSPTVRSFETGKMQPTALAEQMITDLNLQVGSEGFLTELYFRSQRVLPGAVEVRRIPRYYVRATLCNTNALQWNSLIERRDLIGAFDHHFASHLTGKIKPDEEPAWLICTDRQPPSLPSQTFRESGRNDFRN